MKTKATVLIALAIIGIAWKASSQESAPAMHDAVLLKSFECSKVRPGQWIALEWNPGFEYPGVVRSAGISGLRLSRLLENETVTVMQHFDVGGFTTRFKITDLSNGFYRFEFALPPLMQLGRYRITSAFSNANVIEGYEGPPIHMTHNPKDSNFCIILSNPTPPAGRPQ